MKKPSKRDLRDALNRDIEKYLNKGGEVHEYARGESGLQNGRYHEQSMTFEKKQERTPVDDVVKAIDERREARKRPAPSPKKTPRRPKKKVIYDDFGEPVRVIWEE